ncbi:hypothetical protein FE782_11105 [Paenibacillus antri]|uniref:Uncharacterized protein n=1 Tax=Paenibacillus antri TaxID=2582848 RepID=A0A5R9GGI6_9BACL|nr:hypothetical protein [Paenibacillus antri]TLS52498.1 hypothetical protein FE782_11105 [Paenibacillus antri]
MKAVDPYSRQQREINLTTDEINAWNLIEEGNEYFATYEYTSLENGSDLLSIKHPSKVNE